MCNYSTHEYVNYVSATNEQKNRIRKCLCTSDRLKMPYSGYCIHAQTTGWQSGGRLFIMLGLPTHFVQELNVATVLYVRRPKGPFSCKGSTNSHPQHRTHVKRPGQPANMDTAETRESGPSRFGATRSKH